MQQAQLSRVLFVCVPKLGKIHLGLVWKLKGRPGALRNTALSLLDISR